MAWTIEARDDTITVQRKVLAVSRAVGALFICPVTDGVVHAVFCATPWTDAKFIVVTPNGTITVLLAAEYGPLLVAYAGTLL